MGNKVAVITVLYNNYDDLNDYLDSFAKQSSDAFHIYIADLSSSPKQVQLPAFVTLFKAQNKGYASGLNRGLERAQKDGYTKFVCMNNDTTVDKKFISNVLTSLEKNPGSLIGGKIYYYPGFEYHSKRYVPAEVGKVIWYAGGTIDLLHATAQHIGVDEVDKGQFSKFQETGFVTGCLMVFDQQLLNKVGLLDESYFMYYEDTDWNMRVKNAGCSILYDPSLVIWHKNAQSTGGSGSSLHEKYQSINQLKFAWRYMPMRTRLHVLKNYLRKKLFR